MLRKAVVFLGIVLMVGCGRGEVSSAPEQRVDHIIYAASDLETGIAEIETLLGVQPVIGGRHPQYGTHNALLSLGPSTYLEVIAPDPDLPIPERGFFFGTPPDEPRLATWVLRAEDIESLAESAASAGLAIGSVEAGQRDKPDGTAITWKASDPYAMSLQGAVPFLIEWGETTSHPAQSTPSGGRLVELRVEHPKPDDVQRALGALGVDMSVSQADAYRLVATIRTIAGETVELN